MVLTSTLLAVLATSFVAASPLKRSESATNQVTYGGGPPPGLYGTNYTKSGPTDPGTTSFPVGTATGVTSDVSFSSESYYQRPDVVVTQFSSIFSSKTFWLPSG